MESNMKEKLKGKDIDKQKVSDNDSVNQQGAMTNINMPNVISYPRGGAMNTFIKNPDNSNPNNSSNPQGNQNPNNTTPEDHSDKNKKRIPGRLLVFLICVVIIYEYYTFVFYLKPIILPGKPYFWSRLFVLIFFHIFLFMMIWCFIVTMRTIPGFIPLYWGFYIGDEEYKRKRYCLICNAFKPERSHHCSICNICVLNMDHHCPWINNCVGFYNRKFFMQLLFYLFIILYYIDIVCAYEIYQLAMHAYQTKFQMSNEKLLEFVIVIPGYIGVLVLTVLNTIFFKYHVLLVLNNSTTIESLDQENKDNIKVRVLLL